MMILFHAGTLSPKTKFQPEKLSLQLTERSSTASMTVKDTAPTMAVGDWLKIESGPGSDIVWRVKTVDEQYEKHTRTISLEHMINSLKDKIIFDEIKPEYISGQSGVNPTNADTIRFILEEFQRDWVLGGVAGGNVRQPYTFNGDTLYSALGTVTNSIEDSFWQYDMSRYPFRIDIGHLTGQVGSEMRMDRNIRTIKKTVDRTGMFTKFFPVGKNNLHIVGDSVSMNTDLYGVICKSETDQSKDTEEELNRWAHDRIRRHCEPTVTITISGLDLAKATGESLDTFHIGYLCRVPLPEYNTTILERITKLSYSDVISDPMNVTVTLANNLEDVASIINNLSSTATSSAKAAATKAGEDHAWIEDTEDHVALVAEAIIGPDENGVNWSRVSSVVVDGQGIHQQVVKAQGELVVQKALIDINEQRILQEVTDRTNADGELTGRITVQADRITQEVTQRQNDVEVLSGRIIVEKNRITQEVNDRTSADRTLSGRITVEAGRIEQIVDAVGADGQVTAASIVLAINDAGSSVNISGDHVIIGSGSSAKKVKVYIDGEVDAVNAKFNSITVQEGSARYVSSNKVYAPVSLSVGTGVSGGSGSFYYRGTEYKSTYIVMRNASNVNICEGLFLGTGGTTTPLNLTHYHDITITEGTGTDEGKMFVELGKPRDSAGSANFKIADTNAYRSGVLAARNNVKVQAFTADERQGTLNDHRTFTYKTDAPTPVSGSSQADTWYLAQSANWDAHRQKTVSMRYGSTQGTAYAQLTVDATDVYDADHAMCIRDGNNTRKTEVALNAGGSITLYPAFNMDAGGIQTGVPCTVRATGQPGTSYSLYCSSARQDQSGWHYTFTIGTGWDDPWSEGSSYTFYYDD